MSQPIYCGIQEAAKQCACSPDTIRRAIARGDLKAYRLGHSRVIRIKQTDLDKFIRPVTALSAVKSGELR